MRLPFSLAGSGRIPRAVDLSLAAAWGALLSVPLAHTALWPLAFICIAALYARTSYSTPKRAAGLGFVFGSAWLVATVWWLFISMYRYGGLPAPLAAAAVVLLGMTLSTFLAAAMALFAKFRTGKPGRDALLFAACWLLAELARGVAFTGFPWGASGYTQIDAPLAALAPWGGVYGIGFALAGLAATLYEALRRHAWKPAAPALLALALLAMTGPGNFTASSGRLSVLLLQTNVPQDEKFADAYLPRELAWVGQQLRDAKADLIVTPETAVPLLPDQLRQYDPSYWPELASRFAQGRQAALVGVPLGDFEHGYTNSVAGLSRESVTRPEGFYRYDKHHLVPFGEFIPPGFRWFTEMMDIPLGDFSRGPLVAPSFTVQAQRVAPNICYEDLFGEELAARFADAAEAPTMLANISNIGWFGDTAAIAQHLNISRMRALELQRPMLRATNTGATAIVDHRGRVTASLPSFTQATLQGEAEGRTGLTPFAWWASRAGLWPLALMGAGLALALAVATRRSAS